MAIPKKVSRREFVRLAGMAAGAAALGACVAPTPQVIKETAVVEKVVTKEVEKIVTPTPTRSPSATFPVNNFSSPCFFSPSFCPAR